MTEKAPNPDFSFPKKQHLRRPAEFKRVYEHKVSVADHLLIVYGFPNGGPETRIGLSVSRKIGGAVTRNRWKRLIREAFRLNRSNFPDGIDLVVLPKRGAAVPDWDALSGSLRRLFKRIVSRLARNPI